MPAKDYDSPGWEDVNLPLFYILSPAPGLLVRLSTYPIQVAKTRMQVSPHANPTLFATLFRIRRIEGTKSLYRGFAVSVLGVLGDPLYNTALELTRHSLNTKFGESDAKHGAEFATSPFDDPHHPHNRRSASAAIVPFVSGTAASIACLFVANPVDIASQRLQSAGKHVTIKTTFASMVQGPKGILGAYKGFLSSVALCK